jgi:hypothetical protein
MVCLLSAFRRQSHAIGSRSSVFPSGERESGRFCLHQDAALPLSSITFGLFDFLAGIGELLVFSRSFSAYSAQGDVPGNGHSLCNSESGQG